MNSNSNVFKSVVLAAAIAASLSGVARADDNDMTRFGGEGYAYFHEDKPVVSKPASAFHQTNPHGLTEAQYQALSSEDPEWQPGAPVIDRTTPSFRQTNPHGIPFSQYQAWSNEDQVWQLPASKATSIAATPNQGAVARNAVKLPPAL